MVSFPRMITRIPKVSLFADAHPRVKGLFSLLSTLIALLISIINPESLSAQDLYVGSNSSSQTTNFTSGTNSYGSTYVGYNAGASNNILTVANTNTLLTNSADLYVGYNGSGNSLVISNGAQVINNNLWLGYNSNSLNNSVLVTGSNSLLSNMNSYGGFSIGNYGAGTLTLANGGSLQVGDYGGSFSIASQSNSVGTLNFGRLGGSDSANPIMNDSYTYVSFGLGMGAINFNQTNTLETALQINGNGTMNQLGSGTTIFTGAFYSSPGPPNLNIAAGTFQFGDGTTTAADFTGAIVNNSSLVLAPASGLIFNLTGAIGGSGSVTQAGLGTTILKGINVYNGPTRIQSGALEFNGTTTLYGGNTNLWTPSNLIVSSGAYAIFSEGTISVNGIPVPGSGFTATEINSLWSNSTTSNG